MSTESRKVLGQSKPSASALTDAYTVGALTQTIISTLVVCNQSPTIDVFRISVAVNGASNMGFQYLYYDINISGNDTFSATIGLTLNSGDVVRFYSQTGTSNISLFGVEIT